MQYDEEILGFSNRWYAKGIETAVETSLDENITIRHLTPPMFIATKLEAYRGRGGGDLIGSRDAEDILLLVDGRQELVDEVAAADADIRSYIAGEFKRLLSDRDFDHFLEGNIRGPEGRADIVRDRFIAGSATADMAFAIRWQSRQGTTDNRDCAGIGIRQTEVLAIVLDGSSSGAISGVFASEIARRIVDWFVSTDQAITVAVLTA